jgi:uncharacterized protein YjbJ (UPF0337 family)
VHTRRPLPRPAPRVEPNAGERATRGEVDVSPDSGRVRKVMTATVFGDQHFVENLFHPIQEDRHMSGQMDELKGRTKEAVGDLTDDEEMQREGQRDQAAGDVKQKIEDAGDWAKDKVDDVKDRVSNKR